MNQQFDLVYISDHQTQLAHFDPIVFLKSVFTTSLKLPFQASLSSNLHPSHLCPQSQQQTFIRIKCSYLTAFFELFILIND